MFNRPPWVIVALALTLLILTGRAQQQPQPPDQTPSDGAAPAPAQDESQPPIFRSGINFIRVDVIVTDDDGNPVTDLEVGDFEVFEDGEPQTIESFQLIEISAVPSPGAEPPRSVSNRYDEEREAARTDTRVFVIFFDDYHVRYENGVRAGQTLVQFLENNLVPTDLVGIMYPLTPLIDVRLTRNHAAIIRAVDNFLGRKYDYEPHNEYELRYAHYPTETVERLRNDVSLSALKGLMIHLGGLGEGRKNVLLLSEGFTNYVPPELRARSATRGPSPAETTSGNPRFESTAQFFSDSTLMLDIREIYSMANRFNTAIYAIDPRGLAVSEFDASQLSVNLRTDRSLLRATQDTLYVLADRTDGRAIINQNNLIPGLQQMMRDSSTYYLIGYNSTRSPTDGKFHEIDVRVRHDDIQVRHRQGFWAMTERDVERALTTKVNEPPKAVDRALAALVEPRRGQYVRTWVGTSRGENGRTRVTFVWEPLARLQTRGESAARVLLTAMGDTGGAYYRGRVPERGSSARGTARRRAESGPSSVTWVEFEVDPGTMQISMAIEAETGEVLDRDRGEIEIPDFTSTDVVLSTPAFVRARNNMEWQNLVEDWDAVPTANREFRRTDRLLLRFETYAPGTEVPDVKARLLNRGGEPIHPLDVRPGEAGHPYQVDIAPAHLPPGEYVIELAATTPTSETTQLVAFKLVS